MDVTDDLPATEGVPMFFWMLALFLLLGPQVTAAPAPAHVALGVEAEDFQFSGDWLFQTGTKGVSGRACLFAGHHGAKFPAATVIEVPRAGRYHLWVRAMDFPEDRPGIRRLTASVGGRKSDQTFGDSGKSGWTWEPGGAFELAAGPTLVTLDDVDHFYGRVDAVLLTTNEKFVPSLTLGRENHPRVQPLEYPVPATLDPLNAGPVLDTGDKAAAVLENEHLRVEFVPATRDGKPTVRPRVSVKTASGWADVGANADAEAYVAVVCKQPEFDYSGYFAQWKGAPRKPMTVSVGDVQVQSALAAGEAIWDAGESVRFVPRSATAKGNRVRLDFHPSPAGTYSAEWELRPGEHAARVRVALTPAIEAEYALGYHLFFRKPLAEVPELLLPMMWHRRRLPSRPYTLLQPFTPTPVALAQSGTDAGALSWAVVGDPAEIRHAWPRRSDPHFGLMIRDLKGDVQPSIYGPVPGTPSAKAKAKQPVRFAFRVLVQPGDWYAGFRSVADGIFGLRDYRTNVGVSLTDAALNMIDLVMHDEAGGWWERAKGPYQIETLNGATHASPLTVLSLYRLTGNQELYRRRALPTMEFTLSRSHAHFSPEPDNTGIHYTAGSMNGPLGLYGSTVFGGMWEATNRRTQAFQSIAFPETGIRNTAGYSHASEFEDWLARYLITGDAEALKRAVEGADRYLEMHVLKAPTTDIGPQPFFNLTFIPNWEGLLRMYEVTGDKRYLEGAVFGAKQLMTGIWTQPVIPDRNITVHPKGDFAGDVPDFSWWMGPEKYRLGFPRKPGDVKEQKVPAWVPSNVGLGFEQPITYTSAKTGGRMIYQSAFAPNFLRLAAYTGDKTFEMYARNGVLGRWANYPGYYVTGFTNLPLNPRYPYEGPDVSCIYYHHILPHLSWTIDYLVAEAGLRSGGKIAFPHQRQLGYAWFDSRIYGHAPGKVYGEEDVWLWLRRDTATLDNPAINYLPAHNGSKFLLVLMNENSRDEKTTVTFSPKTLGYDPAAVKQVSVLRDGVAAAPASLTGGKATVVVPARGLVVLALDGARIDVPAHRVPPPAKPGAHPGYVALKSDVAGIEARGAAIQMDPGAWDAYVWCTAFPKQARKVTLHFSTGGAWQQREDTEYPYEFSVPVADAATPFRFRMEGETPDGKRFTVPETVMGAMQ